jgi:hypothetical protein
MKKLMFLSLAILLAGCESSTLETGYAPRKLSDNAAVRSSYYASPYSPNPDRAGATSIDPGMRAPGQY